MKPYKNGVLVAEMFEKNRAVYRYWYADVWHCAICNLKVIFRFAEEPAAQHFEKDKMAMLEMRFITLRKEDKESAYHCYEVGAPRPDTPKKGGHSCPY